MAAGQTEAARTDLRELAARTNDQELRHAIERRLTRDLANAGAVLSPAEKAALDRDRGRCPAGPSLPPAGRRRLAPGSVTLALLFLNLGVFGLETIRGGSENLRTLLRMGALWPPAVLAHAQWYRLLTALFLHFGPVHLAMNLLGLAVIGPWVEKTLGRARYTLVYFVAGIGSMAAVLGFIRWGWMREEVLVGASGAIMGLIGAMGALLAVGWRRERSGLAARRLRGVVLIVVLQVVFDLDDPAGQLRRARRRAGGWISADDVARVPYGKAWLRPMPRRPGKDRSCEWENAGTQPSSGTRLSMFSDGSARVPCRAAHAPRRSTVGCSRDGGLHVRAG